MSNIFPEIDRTKLDKFYKDIGNNVKKLRKDKGFTQLEVAIMIGQKSTSFYSNCENFKNKEHFNLEHLFLIADVLKVDICEILKPQNN